MSLPIMLVSGAILLFLVLGVAGTRARPAKFATFYARCKYGLASFTIGAQSGSGSGATRNVAVQLKDANGVAIAEVAHCQAYLSDSATGVTLTAVAPTTLAIGTNGVIIGVLTTAKAVKVVTDASGRFDLTITENTANSYYLVVCMPDGSISVSAVIAMS